MTSDSLCWNKHGSLVSRDSHHKKANPKNWYSTHRKPTQKAVAEQEAEKLPASIPRQSWNKLWDFHTSTCSHANPWKDYHPTTSSPNKTKKVHPFHQTSFPIWTPPWRRACSTVCEGGNLGNKNWALGLVLHLVITSLYVGHVILCVSVYLNIIIVISMYSLLTSGRFPPKRRF